MPISWDTPIVSLGDAHFPDGSAKSDCLMKLESFGTGILTTEILILLQDRLEKSIRPNEIGFKGKYKAKGIDSLNWPRAETRNGAIIALYGVRQENDRVCSYCFRIVRGVFVGCYKLAGFKDECANCVVAGGRTGKCCDSRAVPDSVDSPTLLSIPIREVNALVESSERKRTISISKPSSSPTRKKVKPALKSDSSDSDIICLNDQQDSPEILLQKMKDLVASCKNLSNFTRETYRQSKHVLEKVQALVDKQEDDIEAEQI